MNSPVELLSGGNSVHGDSQVQEQEIDEACGVFTFNTKTSAAGISTGKPTPLCVNRARRQRFDNGLQNNTVVSPVPVRAKWFPEEFSEHISPKNIDHVFRTDRVLLSNQQSDERHSQSPAEQNAGDSLDRLLLSEHVRPRSTEPSSSTVLVGSQAVGPMPRTCKSVDTALAWAELGPLGPAGVGAVHPSLLANRAGPKRRPRDGGFAPPGSKGCVPLSSPGKFLASRPSARTVSPSSGECYGVGEGYSLLSNAVRNNYFRNHSNTAAGTAAH